MVEGLGCILCLLVSRGKAHAQHQQRLNKKILDIAEDFKSSGDIMEKFYEVVKEHSKVHGGNFRSKAAEKYRDSLSRKGIVSTPPHWIFELDEHGDISDTSSFWIVQDGVQIVDTVKFKIRK